MQENKITVFSLFILRNQYARTDSKNRNIKNNTKRITTEYIVYFSHYFSRVILYYIKKLYSNEVKPRK